MYFEIFISLLFPFLIFLFYIVIKRPDIAFFLMVLGVPLSINSEEFLPGAMALFTPTEPIMILMMVVYFIIEVINPGTFDPRIFRHPIFRAYMVYLCWLFISSLTSMMPMVSIKFLIAHCWLFLPVFVFGSYLFKNKENIYRFFFLFNLSLVAVCIYTLVNHSFYRFLEKPAHWVMSPFFKDHTSYGAIVALGIPVVVGLISTGRYKGRIQAFLYFSLMVLLAALVLSFTRAAWLSLVAGILILPFVYFRINIRWIVAGVVILALIFISGADKFLLNIKENRTDSSGDFGEHITSMANISTDASNVERLNRWDCAISMFKEKPLTGWGPGTYQFFYAPFQKPELMTIISTYFEDGGNAHSEYLGPLAETGIFGLLTFLGVVIVLFYKGFSNYWEIDDPVLRKMYLAAMIGLSTYFIHGFLNNFLDTDKAAVPVWGIAAFIVSIDLYHGRKAKLQAKAEGTEAEV